jgi:hypothetical protein
MKSLHPRINLRLGLIRLWIVITFAWSAFWIWYLFYCFVIPDRFWFRYGFWRCPEESLFQKPGSYVALIFLSVVPTAVAFVGVYAMILLGILATRFALSIKGWVVRGFERD